MANEKKVRLLNQAGEELYPRTTMDNILTAVGSTVYANLVKLNGAGKIDAQYLPSYVDDIVELVAMQATEPTTCATGDVYFNTETLKLYTATATDTWGTEGADPENGVIYLDISNPNSAKMYRWAPASSQMIEIYQQYAVTSNVTSDSDDTAVPTAKAAYDIASSLAASAQVEPAGSAGVATALGGVYVGNNISVNAGGTISIVGASVGVPGVAAFAAHTAVTSDSTDETTAVTPKGVATLAADYQKKITTSSNITLNGGTLSVALAGATTAGLVKVPSQTTSGVSQSVDASGELTVAGVAGTTAAVGVVQLAKIAETTSAATDETKAVTPKGLATLLGNYQTAITTSNNVSLNGGTITVAIAGATTLGLVKVPTSTTSGVSQTVDANGQLTVAGVAGTTTAAGVLQLAKKAETTSAATDETKAVTPGGLANLLGDYQVKFTTSSNITINGTTIGVPVGGATLGVLAIDNSDDKGVKISATGGTVKTVVSAAAVGQRGTVAITAGTNCVGPHVTGGTYYTGTFTGTDTAVTPELLGSAMVQGVFWQAL